MEKQKDIIINNILKNFWAENGKIAVKPAFRDKFLTILDTIKPSLIVLKKEDIEETLRGIFIVLVMNEFSTIQKVNLYKIKIHPTIELILKNETQFQSYFNKNNLIFQLITNLLVVNQKKFVLLIILVITFVIILIIIVMFTMKIGNGDGNQMPKNTVYL